MAQMAQSNREHKSLLSSPMVLLKVPRSHDLVLEFESDLARKRFLTKLEAFAEMHQKSVEVAPVYK